MSVPPEDRGLELRELFFETAHELLQVLNEEALKLEKSPGDAEVMRSIRRVVHTLKGDAAACGFHELSELAHELEDALALENPAIAALVAETVFPAADLFAAMLAAHRAGNRCIIHFDQVGGLVAAAEHRVLQCFDIARGGIVDDNDGQPDAGAARGFELAQCHIKTAIAADCDDRGCRRRQCGADAAGQPIADRG